MLDRGTLEKIGYDLWLLTHLPPVRVTEPLEPCNLLGPYSIVMTYPQDYPGIMDALQAARAYAAARRVETLVCTADDAPRAGFDGLFNERPELRFCGWGRTVKLSEAL